MEEIIIGKELRALNNVIKRAVENLPNLQYAKNITGTNGWIIAYLVENQDREIYQKDLEKQFSVTRSTASKVIKRMEEKGLILREGVPEDARLKRLTLTQVALEMHNAIAEDIRKLEARLTQGFSKEELDVLRENIARMKLNMKQFVAEDL